PLAGAETPLRVERLMRCGDLLASEQQQWCLQVSGLTSATPRLVLGGKELAPETIQRNANRLSVQLQRRDHESGPLWLHDGQRVSNSVWLSLRGSHVLAAAADEVAQNMDGLTTYVDLVSLLIEEHHDGRQEAQRLAD